MELLTKTIKSIGTLDKQVMAQMRLHIDNLTKPPNSLGRLEEIAVQIGGITGDLEPNIKKRSVVLFAADHGVVAEGVSAFPQEVTVSMVQNFLNGGAAVNVFARQANAEIRLVDIGMKGTFEHPDLLQRKVRQGTANFCRGPAMSEKEAIDALEIGISLAHEAKNQSVDLLATGEMGIGNTTASSALAVVLGKVPLEKAVGRGTGLNKQGLANKRDVIKRAIELNQPNASDPLSTLAKVGGLEIAGLAGLILGAAAYRIPIIIDGFISSVAALAAAKLAPNSKNFMLASHASAEPGHRLVLQEIGLEPMIHLDMCLGEGTGAVLMMHLVEASLLMAKEMATFEEAGITAG